MKSVNLIPAPRRAAKCRRAHLRRCAAGCAVWGVLSLGVAVTFHGLWGRGTAVDSGDRLAKAEEDVQRTERAVASLRRQLEVARSNLRANQAIANQPDWSILLAVLGQKVGDEVVLRSCRVRPADARTTAPGAPGRPAASATGRPAAEAAPFILEATGMAKTHKAADTFVLALEKTGLFARVTLLDRTREAFLDADAIAFKLQCPLSGEAPAVGAQSTVSAVPTGGKRPTRQSVTSSTVGERQ